MQQIMMWLLRGEENPPFKIFAHMEKMYKPLGEEKKNQSEILLFWGGVLEDDNL